MTLDPVTLLPFILFAFVASITPGPTNILVLTNSSRHGLGATAPIVLGACAGAALIVLLVGMGIGESLGRYPLVVRAMSWLGIAWLSYLAWQIFSSPAPALDGAHSPGEPARLGLWGAASLQLVNPKTWMMALAVASVFAGSDVERNSRVMLLSLTFFVVAVPCMSAWALLGAASARLIRSSSSLRRFNQCMALLLLASAWMTLVL